jgi:hypothetical protein
MAIIPRDSVPKQSYARVSATRHTALASYSDQQPRLFPTDAYETEPTIHFRGQNSEIYRANTSEKCYIAVRYVNTLQIRKRRS